MEVSEVYLIFEEMKVSEVFQFFSLLFANFMYTHMLDACLFFYEPMIYETVDINLAIICFQACIVIGI